MKRFRRRHLLWTALLLAVLGLIGWINLPLFTRLFDQSEWRVRTMSPLPAPRPGQRLLIIAPHPDDEVLCCAGLIQRAQQAGAQVWLTWITAGDGFEFDAMLTGRVLRPGPQRMRALGTWRASEAQRAGQRLAIPQGRQLMLGYPDRGLQDLLGPHWTKPLNAKHTQVAAVYLPQALNPGAPYTGQALAADLRRVLDLAQPDLVFVPAPQDAHPDHQAVAKLAQRLLSERHQPERLRFWVVHGGLEWPIPKGLHPELLLTVPPRASRLPWQRLDLSPEERDRKGQALNAYPSQTRVMGRFLRAFVRRNELFSPQAEP